MIAWIIIIILSICVILLIAFPPKTVKEVETRYKETLQEMAIWKQRYEEKQKSSRRNWKKKYEKVYDKKLKELEKMKKEYKEEMDNKVEIEITRSKKDFCEWYQNLSEPVKEDIEESWGNKDRY